MTDKKDKKQKFVFKRGTALVPTRERKQVMIDDSITRNVWRFTY